jgi:hypothetical protein
MPDTTSSVRQLLTEAEHLPFGPAKLAVLQEAVQIADTHRDIDLGIEARRSLMITARNVLRGDILTAAFTWCLAHYDREPQRFHGRDLLWEHEMVIGQLANLPDVSRETLESLLADLERRLQAAGFSLLPRYRAQRAIAPDLGDRDLGLAADRELRRLSGDRRRSLSPHERSEEILFALFVGDEERALQLGRPYLKDRSGAWPGSEYGCSALLVPLLKRNRIAEAVRLQRYCLRAYHPERCYYWQYGDLLKWLILSNQPSRAVAMYEQCQRAITPQTDPLTRLHFALDAIVLFDRLHQTGPQTLSLRLPDHVTVRQTEGRYDVEDLREWLHQEARQWAERFDRRNGNDYFQTQLQERIALQQWARTDAASGGEQGATEPAAE